ncbi:MAG: ATPase, T2SS/T4P/T4SS family [Candidatus Woesearchaeota archaeon]
MDIIPTQQVIEHCLFSGLEYNKIYIHEAVFRKLSDKGLKALQGLDIIFIGDPREEDLVKAAYNESATIVMTDAESTLQAKARGVPIIQLPLKAIDLNRYFGKETLSIHLREGEYPYAKEGLPGRWVFRRIEDEKITREMMFALIPKDSTVEKSSSNARIMYHENYRLILTTPPLSSSWELTVVRLTHSCSLEEFNPSQKLHDRINKQAEGILIAGAPGMGKTTFAHGLLYHYMDMGKVIKTVESPRDIKLPVTQYALRRTSHDELRDLLLLSRPDYTFFDEMRNASDFQFYADLRLSGIGLVGVLHAKRSIDAIHRFIRRLDLGLIPQIVDTIIFIENGSIHSVLSVQMEVKVPVGMSEKDLARPVIVVRDFETGSDLYEIYSYGDETVVIPVKSESAQVPLLENEIRRYTDDYDIEFLNNRLVAYVPRKVRFSIVGKNGENITLLEEKVGYPIDIKEKVDQVITPRERVAYSVSVTSNSILFDVQQTGPIDFYIDDEFILTAHASKKGQINIKKDNIHGDSIIRAIKSGKKLALYKR